MPVSDQGVTRDRYQLIPRTLIFVTNGERVLLLKGAPDKRLWADQYNGIGGHIERGEDVITAARRELLEETGLEIKQLWLCGVITVDANPATGIGIFVLRGEAGEAMRTRSENLMESREGELEWVKLEQISDLKLVEDLYLLLPRVLAMKMGDIPFSAHYAYAQDGSLRIAFSKLDN